MLVYHCWINNRSHDHCQVNNSDQELPLFLGEPWLPVMNGRQSEVDDRRGKLNPRFQFCFYQQTWILVTHFMFLFFLGLLDDDIRLMGFLPCDYEYCDFFIPLPNKKWLLHCLPCIICSSFVLTSYARLRASHVTFWRLRFPVTVGHK